MVHQSVTTLQEFFHPVFDFLEQNFRDIAKLQYFFDQMNYLPQSASPTTSQRQTTFVGYMLGALGSTINSVYKTLTSTTQNVHSDSNHQMQIHAPSDGSRADFDGFNVCGM